ncbi:hypothetical protein ACLB2K_027059 [Fragaria x ananassa]
MLSPLREVITSRSTSSREIINSHSTSSREVILHATYVTILIYANSSPRLIISVPCAKSLLRVLEHLQMDLLLMDLNELPLGGMPLGL